MPLRKVIADFSRGVFSPLSSKHKGNQKNSYSYYQNCRHSTLPSRHIYYEPPDDFDWDATSSLLPDLNSAGEVVVHHTPTSPDSKSGDNSRKDSGLPQSDTNISSDNSKDSSKEKERAYTEEEFTSAILARSRKEEEAEALNSSPDAAGDLGIQQDMGDSGVASMVRDPVLGNCQTVGVSKEHEECDCERRCSNPKHAHDSKSDDYAVSPVLERRNKSVLGRLRNFASRSSYSQSEDGHSHSSDYEEPEDDKRAEVRFSRDARERSSTSWAGRVRDLHRDVKKKISRFRTSKGNNAEEEIGEGAESSDYAIQAGSSIESIPSGSGSSLQPPTPTSSNRSSTSAGEDEHNAYMGTFIGRARALVDCIPSPYDRDGLAFKKDDVIDIIAKHKTGLWVGMAQGKVGHFKFINVVEIVEERKKKHRRRKINSDILDLAKIPENLEELLKQLGLQEYTNVLVLNGYGELESFKEIDKVDLENLGIVDSDHSSKLLRAAEMLQDADLDEDEEELEEDDTQVKQSPRDSGCYASHENLIHGDCSQRALSNGQFMVDLEDQDTSHSESGIHSRDGQGSTVMMNNLDVSAESSSKSTAAADDVNGSSDRNENTNDLSNYNILPTKDGEAIASDSREVTASASAAETTVPKRDADSSSVSIPYILASAGPKSSPGSPRKSRNKHSRNKSHSHRSKDLFNDISLNSLGYAKYRHISAETSPEQSTYVYSWSSFTRSEKNSRRNFHDYDDVVSDPATETEDSPGRHVYKRVKQRKGSLQTLIHETRPPSPTLIAKVNQKLVVEKIYLYEEPYTDKTGFCGIPPALVQRYAEELQHSIVEVADALDQIRITSLQQQARRGVPNDFLSDSCVVPVVEPNYSSLRSWLISLGLPMYESNFTSAGLRELYHISTLTIDDLAHLGIHDSYHQVYLESALVVLYLRFRKRPQTYAEGQSLS